MSLYDGSDNELSTALEAGGSVTSRFEGNNCEVS